MGDTPSRAANLRWKPMATLQRPTALCPAWSSARVTMPTGLVKSMIQASGLVRRTRSAMSSTTGTVRSALARPCGAGGLLADAAALQWPGLVLVAGGLSADAQLEQDRVGAVHPGVQVTGGGDGPGVALLGEDPPGESAHEVEAVGRRVDEDELLDRQGAVQTGEPVDQFGGVGGPATHYSELHVSPSLRSV